MLYICAANEIPKNDAANSPDSFMSVQKEAQDFKMQLQQLRQENEEQKKKVAAVELECAAKVLNSFLIPPC